MRAVLTRRSLERLSAADAAATWLVHFDASHPTEVGLFEEWLAATAENRAAWDAANAAWAALDANSAADDAAFSLLRAEAFGDVDPPMRRVLAQTWRPVAAAAVVSLVVVGAMRIERTPPPASPSGTRFAADYASASSGPRRLRLPDGTRIELDPGSSVHVAFVGARRAVTLDRGRAEFAVYHNAARPFTVAAAGVTVTALGTHFTIDRDADATVRVALIEGTVRVAGRGAELVLAPGQEVFAGPGAEPRLASDGEDQRSSSGDMVQLDDVTLAEAAQRINIGSQVQLVIPDPAVAKLRVSGRFRLGDTARFARSVSELLPVRAARVGDGKIELQKRR